MTSIPSVTHDKQFIYSEILSLIFCLFCSSLCWLQWHHILQGKDQLRAQRKTGTQIQGKVVYNWLPGRSPQRSLWLGDKLNFLPSNLCDLCLCTCVFLLVCVCVCETDISSIWILEWLKSYQIAQCSWLLTSDKQKLISLPLRSCKYLFK